MELAAPAHQVFKISELNLCICQHLVDFNDIEATHTVLSSVRFDDKSHGKLF